MIPKVTLMELYRDVFRRSTLISIPDLSELLVVPGGEFTKWEAFASIVRDALKKWEYYYPLCLVQKIYLNVDRTTGLCQIAGNFEGYLNGAVDEDQVVIIPAAIVGLSKTMYVSSIYPLRAFKYNPPYLSEFFYGEGIYYANTVCKRPFVEEYNEVTKEPTDKSGVYFLNRDVDSTFSIFRDELYRQTCRYFLNLRKNLMLQNMPVELFQGLEEDYQRLEGYLDGLYQQALIGADWII